MERSTKAYKRRRELKQNCQIRPVLATVDTLTKPHGNWRTVGLIFVMCAHDVTMRFRRKHLPKTKALDARIIELPKPTPLFLTTDEVAKVYGVSSKHVRDMLARGELRGVKLGGAWRVPRSALQLD